MTAYSFDPAKARGENATIGSWEERLHVPDPHWYDYSEVYGTDTSGLVANFKEALRQLEELIYAIMGSVPKYSTDPAERKKWWQRDNPRCLWPEQETTLHHFGAGSYEEWDYFQYAADGQYSSIGPGNPQGGGAVVPIRSQSGDPTKQYAAAQHGPGFGLGSVDRDHSTDPFDPPHDQATEVRWTPVPDEVFGIIGVNLVTTVGTFAMTLTTGTWAATIPAQAQGTVVKWYLSVLFSPHAELWALYEPQRPGSQTQPPNPEDQYSYVSFTHVLGPYASGLPELMTRYGEYDPDDSEASVRQGTETWEFNSMEDIQPEHINMARFALDYLGRRCQHNPNSRGVPENCCFNMWIEWRWSGSNRHWVYVPGAKEGTSPLSNSPLDTPLVDQVAVRSWRGLAMLFKYDPFGIGDPDNFYYGSDESWLTKYLTPTSDPDTGDEFTSSNMFDVGGEAGIQPGDVIDPVHLQEIIDAVDYMISNGCWRLAPTFSEKKSPMTAHKGWACGWTRDWPDFIGEDLDTCFGQCCLECPPDGGIGDCVPYAAPTWLECQGQNDKCNFKSRYSTHCAETGDGSQHWGTDCSVTPPHPGGGSATFGCTDVGGTFGVPEDIGTGQDAYGWAAYLCGPSNYQSAPGEGTYFPSGDPAWSSIDTNHGNAIRKMRRIDVPGGEDIILTALANSMGNSFDTLLYCQTSGHVTPGFLSVTGVKWDGLVTLWLESLSCEPGEWITGYPYADVPGLGSEDINGVPICYSTCPVGDEHHVPGGEGEDTQDSCSGQCTIDQNRAGAANCKGDSAYVRVDYNLTGGDPRLHDYDLTIRGLDDITGTPNEVIPWDFCPCDTEKDRSDPCVAGWPP